MFKNSYKNISGETVKKIVNSKFGIFGFWMRGNCRYGHFKILDFSSKIGILKILIFFISINGDTQS